ncbi:phosphotransferase family protein [Ligilactobacillus hayakitensis DSM 18933 = JCM 14209]|uniref:Phosphotransferase family protein n=1 Tax=Ligilactobacillus hayakitensis DSM 18933 = JCM 14209 TaxID=1423755 RepID=A0A0R1WP55_9LACO|nr:phosphotransferase family protein [Ligilactobacillus hayakitensis]KRM19425.1 phosphotransferase family protein [Ligilactobacillus hayakitensis DSM 18933 = JCM 14209]
MNFSIDKGWHVLPLGGNTNSAFMGIRKNEQHAVEKIFLKRNTSPFLAALSLEEITPRLMWTKTMISGDTLTAQEWLNGRSVSKDEMVFDKRVKSLLYKVHHSSVLKKMLRQVGGQVKGPTEFLDEYQSDLSEELRNHPTLIQAVFNLKQNLPEFERQQFTVCHGDLNHKNWLLSDTDQLYLVDWESAKIADPASDLSMLMCQYVPRTDWEQWVIQYGIQVDDNLRYRIYWYSVMNLLLEIKEKYQRGRFNEMNQDILKISEYIGIDR